jgi:GNAT superfamily N-acetyltransferase
MQWISRLAELTEDWKYIAQHEGWSSAISAIVSKLLSLLYRRRHFIVLARSLMPPLPDLQPGIDLEIRPFEHSDLNLIRGFDLPSDVKLCARRLERGHRGVLALTQSQFAGYAWSYTATQPALDYVRFDLLPTDVLLISDYTVSTFRGRGIQTALILARLRIFHDLGYQRAFTCISPDNCPSIAAYRKVGGYEYGVIDDLRFGPWRRKYYKQNNGFRS